ncbi:MAG: NADH-quinone oxidoreductase subunit C [Ardenticatenaceae bacterium]|nr:NADH-quinone oxidoreductase subunit C [Anaerolineales bacterium]MCB8920808.1 NADH-quinone oxidoreductase subunit C [Ardenticatenaceae bacterium]MCB8989767.1 NADH-quinone oxidoreductase subunit C [Ardenticatenaceae bacterium]MCB9002774.1 NADH-quinone oxidoreductase subunit C [Ardenticatenaceae bacterium]
MNRNQLVFDKITAAIPDAIEEVLDFRGEQTLFIYQKHIKAVCQFLRDDAEMQYNMLSDVCADDMLPDYPRFAVNYHLYSIPQNHRLRLRVRVEDPDDGPETVGAIWAVATWLEMEVWDLMGVRFKNNTSLRRLFLPEDWQGHPLRKDYPLGYEDVQFSFNWENIDAKKPYAQE